MPNSSGVGSINRLVVLQRITNDYKQGGLVKNKITLNKWGCDNNGGKGAKFYVYSNDKLPFLRNAFFVRCHLCWEVFLIRGASTLQHCVNGCHKYKVALLLDAILTKHPLKFPSPTKSTRIKSSRKR